MRRDKQFTLKQLKSTRDITPEDCQNLFDYAKVLYELEKFQRKDPSSYTQIAVVYFACFLLN